MTVETFLERVAVRSPKSAATYKHALKMVLNHTGKSPDQILSEVKENGDAAYEVLERIVTETSKARLAPKSTRLLIAATKRLLEDELDFEWSPTKLRKIKRILPKDKPRSVDRVPTSEEIYRLVQRASMRTRTALLLQLTSGLRTNECAQLRIEYFDFNSSPIKLRLPGEITKSKEARITFITEECGRALKEFLGERTTGFVFPKKNGKGHADSKQLAEQVTSLLKRTDLRVKMSPESPCYALHPHTFRKFFHTKLESVGVPKSAVDQMVGHAPDMDGQSYIRYTEEQLAQFYASHEDALTFLSANNRGLKEKVRDQTQEIKDLQERLSRLEAVSSEKLKIKER